MKKWYKSLTEDGRIFVNHIVVGLGLIVISSAIGLINEGYRAVFALSLFTVMIVLVLTNKKRSR